MGNQEATAQKKRLVKRFFVTWSTEHFEPVPIPGEICPFEIERYPLKRQTFGRTGYSAVVEAETSEEAVAIVRKWFPDCTWLRLIFHSYKKDST